MRPRRELERGLLAPRAVHHVVRLARALRHRLVKQVGHAEEQVVEVALHRLGLPQLVLRPVRHLAQAVLQRLLARLRELLRQPVLLGLDALRRVQVLAPFTIELKDLVDRRRLTLQLGRAAHSIRIAPDELEGQHQPAVSGRITGNRITSRIDGWSVSNMTRRSMPMPRPPHGGSPYSTARRKSSSMGCASTSPAARIAACASNRSRWSTGSVSSVNAFAYSRP